MQYDFLEWLQAKADITEAQKRIALSSYTVEGIPKVRDIVISNPMKLHEQVENNWVVDLSNNQPPSIIIGDDHEANYGRADAQKVYQVLQTTGKFWIEGQNINPAIQKFIRQYQVNVQPKNWDIRAGDNTASLVERDLFMDKEQNYIDRLKPYLNGQVSLAQAFLSTKTNWSEVTQAINKKLIYQVANKIGVAQLLDQPATMQTLQQFYQKGNPIALKNQEGVNQQRRQQMMQLVRSQGGIFTIGSDHLQQLEV